MTTARSILLLLATAHLAAADSTPPSVDPARPSGPVDVEIDTTVVSVEPRTRSGGPAAAITLGADPRFVLTLHIDSLRRGPAPIAAGSNLSVAVHSLAKLLGAAPADRVVGQVYTFRLQRDAGPTAPWRLTRVPAVGETFLLEEGAPQRSRSGVVFLLAHFSHKEYADGSGVAGIWDLEVRAEGTTLRHHVVALHLDVEDHIAGHVLTISQRSDGRVVAVYHFAPEPPPLDESAARELARAALQERGVALEGSALSLEDGVYRVSTTETPPSRVSIGRHTRRVLTVEIGADAAKRRPPK